MISFTIQNLVCKTFGPWSLKVFFERMEDGI
jgi:hypothetical protein